MEADNERSIVVFEYDCCTAYQDCVRDFSENKSCANESCRSCKYTQTL